MDQLYVGILGCILFIVLIFIRVPIAYAMGIVGHFGTGATRRCTGEFSGLVKAVVRIKEVRGNALMRA
jgi:hypothetical protein